MSTCPPASCVEILVATVSQKCLIFGSFSVVSESVWSVEGRKQYKNK